MEVSAFGRLWLATTSESALKLWEPIIGRQNDPPVFHPPEQQGRFPGFGKVPVGSENRVTLQ
jgi:hypothetical protein